MTHSGRTHSRNISLSVPSQDSPLVILTPPPPEEVVRETRRLSISVTNDDSLLLPPEPREPEEVVNQLIKDRRASTITLLSDALIQIFIKKKVKEDGIPIQVVDNVYLGSIGAAHNLQWLKVHGITHILCVAGNIAEKFPKHFKYKTIDIVDAPSVNIHEYFEETFEYIENCINVDDPDHHLDHHLNHDSDQKNSQDIENIENVEARDESSNGDTINTINTINKTIIDIGAMDAMDAMDANDEDEHEDHDENSDSDHDDNDDIDHDDDDSDADDNARCAGKILIHCFAGVSRSVTIASAYVMKKYSMDAVSALTLVRSKREQANPNAGFILQLLKYQRVLGIKRQPVSSNNNSSNDEKDDHTNTAPKKRRIVKFKNIVNNRLLLKQRSNSNPTPMPITLNVSASTIAHNGRASAGAAAGAGAAAAAANANANANANAQHPNQKLIVIRNLHSCHSNVSNRSLVSDSGNDNETEDSFSNLDKTLADGHHIIRPGSPQHSRGPSVSMESNDSAAVPAQHPHLFNKLSLKSKNAAIIDSWESGRRPSIFSALAKLRALKKRSQSTESVSISVDDRGQVDNNTNHRESEMKANLHSIHIQQQTINEHEIRLQPPSLDPSTPVTDDANETGAFSVSVSPAVSPVSTLESPHMSNLAPITPMCLTPRKLQLLKEASVEDDEDRESTLSARSVIIHGKTPGPQSNTNTNDNANDNDNANATDTQHLSPMVFHFRATTTTTTTTAAATTTDADADADADAHAIVDSASDAAVNEKTEIV